MYDPTDPISTKILSKSLNMWQSIAKIMGAKSVDGELIIWGVLLNNTNPFQQTRIPQALSARHVRICVFEVVYL